MMNIAHGSFVYIYFKCSTIIYESVFQTFWLLFGQVWFCRVWSSTKYVYCVWSFFYWLFIIFTLKLEFSQFDIEMVYMPTTRLFLRTFGIYPNKKLSKHGLADTLYILILSLPLWFVLLTSYAYFAANLQTADIAVITDSMYTSFIFTMMCGNFILLAMRKFEIRKVIDDIGKLEAERELNISFISSY